MRVVFPAQKVKRPCPDCGAPLLKRDSKMLTPLIARTLVICRNITCGATFSGLEEICYRLSPSTVPNVSLNIPMSPREISIEILESANLVPEEETEHEPEEND